MKPYKFLVICRAGDSSLHKRWLQPGKKKNFDLMIDYYGNDTGRYAAEGDFYYETKGMKWPRIYSIIEEQHELISTYDAIWVPDDDLSINAAQINRMFTIFMEHGMDLAQPALTPNSYYSHPITFQQRKLKLRFTNFVEIMAPIFSKKALSICWETFNESCSGWGLDWIWPKLLSGLTIGIIDETPVRHTRRVGGGDFYNKLKQDPGEEMMNVSQKYGVELPYVFEVTGQIRKQSLYQKLLGVLKLKGQPNLE